MKKNNFLSEKNDIEILFVGDSHMLKAVVPTVFKKKVFSLSFPATNYIQLYYLLKSYLNKMPALKLIIFEVDYNNFSSYKTNSFGPYSFWNNYIDYVDLMKVKGPLILLNKVKCLTVLDESFGREHFLINLLGCFIPKNNLEKIKERWLQEKKVTAKIRATNHFKNSKVPDKDLLLYFERILKLSPL